MNRVFGDLASRRVAVTEIANAVALDLHRRGLVDVFVVADRLLGEIAAQECLAVQNPEDQ